ncbi:MAG: 50S ribosomal protein L21 [Clostridiales bacterium]|jgi:large subunit ribosomal protein L21|nr:50S ribosomal protein L21 [Clostridiales bacterium]
MYAVIETGGKQYKVAVNDEIFIEKLNAEAESEVVFDKVVTVVDGDNLSFGAPYVEGAEVKATVIKNGKAKKITVMTYRAKKNSKRKLGHRQPYTKVRIDAINVK